jgi:hypothetical protein
MTQPTAMTNQITNKNAMIGRKPIAMSAPCGASTPPNPHVNKPNKLTISPQHTIVEIFNKRFIGRLTRFGSLNTSPQRFSSLPV